MGVGWLFELIVGQGSENKRRFFSKMAITDITKNHIFSTYLNFCNHFLSNFAFCSLVVVSLSKYENTVGVLGWFTSNQHLPIFDACGCHRSTTTKFTVLKMDDPCFEGICGTDNSWALTSSNLILMIGFSYRKV